VKRGGKSRSAESAAADIGNAAHDLGIQFTGDLLDVFCHGSLPVSR
jgi:hypothetical protein